MFQVFSGSPLPRFPFISYDRTMKKIMKGELPPRPPGGERLGLDDEVWDKLRECLDFRPQVRPTAEGVRTFFEPLHQKGIPLKPDDVVMSDTTHQHDENDNCVDPTHDSECAAPSRSRSTTRTSPGDILLASEESPGSAPFPEPAPVSTRTHEWIATQQSDLFPKTSPPGVTFEENPVMFDISLPISTGTHDNAEPTESWTCLL